MTGPVEHQRERDEPLDDRIRVDRGRLLFAAIVTVVLAPLVVFGSFRLSDSADERRPAAAQQEPVRVTFVAKGASIAPTDAPERSTDEPDDASLADTFASATSTTRPVTTTTMPEEDTTGTTEPPPPPPERRNREDGQASWFDGEPGACMHRSLRLGTVVQVSNVTNGNSTTCTVTRRGPYAPGRILDLERSTFTDLAPISETVITVRIEW